MTSEIFQTTNIFSIWSVICLEQIVLKIHRVFVYVDLTPEHASNKNTALLDMPWLKLFYL